MAHRTTNLTKAFLACLCIVATAACAETAEEPTGGGAGPRVTSLSETSLVVGEEVLFFGRNFRRGGEDGSTRLRFVGEYLGDDGSATPVDHTVTPLWDGVDGTTEILRLSRFGPYGVPFGVQETGVFKGTVQAINVLEDGTQMQGSPMSTEINVGPSVVIEELQPIIAECGQPALRGIGGLPYRMKVRAIGFTPARFEYEITGINGFEGTTPFSRTASGPTDVLGEDEPFVLNPLADEEKFRVTEIRVHAYDAKGAGVEQVLPFTVHRPIEYHYDGNQQVGAIYKPTPVTGCIPGSIGNRVTYSETVSETRQNSVSITVSRNWNRSNSRSEASDWQEGYTEGTTISRAETESARLSETNATAETYGVNYNTSTANDVGYSSTNGEDWQWDTTEGVSNTESIARLNEISGEVSGSVAASGGASVPLLAEGSVTVTAGVKAGGRTNTERGEATEVRSEHGFSSGGSMNETNSFGTTTTDSQGTSVTGTYSVSSTAETGRSTTDTEARMNSRTYSLGGTVSEEETIQEGLTEAETQTFVESSTNSTLTAYSGVIPVGRFGVFYRQTIRNTRIAQLRSYDLCGVSEIQSEMMFHEWTWSPDLAIGDTCDNGNLPESNLPPEECFYGCN